MRLKCNNRRQSFPGAGITWIRTVGAFLCFVLSLAQTTEAWAADVEVVKQKGCNLLLRPSTGLNKGDVLDARSLTRKQISLKIISKNSRSAKALMTPQGGRCESVNGETLRIELAPEKDAKRFLIGVSGTAGQFTFRQKIAPRPIAGAPDVGTEKVVDGLSGVGFSGSAVARFVLRRPLALELGVGALGAQSTGKVKLENGDEFSVLGKFAEVVVQPEIAFTSCISSRLFCKGGGVFAFPIKSTINVKDVSLDETTALTYNRMGGVFSAGINLGKNLNVLAGGQISYSQGSFKFPSLPEKSDINVLTVYIFGGFTAVF